MNKYHKYSQVFSLSVVHKSTVHKGGSVGNSVGGVDDGGGVDNRGNSVVGNGVDGGSVGDDLRVGSSAVVGDLGDVAVDGIGVVVRLLDLYWHTMT